MDFEKMWKGVKNWLRNKENLTFLAILLCAFIIRLYYFYLTKGQALWWDEAEYGLRAKAFAFGTPLTGWAPEREILVPLLFSLFLKVGLGEIALRILQLIVSVATVAMTYILIAKVSEKKYGLYASFGMAFFWLHVFFTERVLLYLWAPLMFLIIAYLFYTGYVKGNNKHLVWFGIMSAVGLATYFSVGFLLAGIFVYLLFIEGGTLFKNKKAWKALVIFILVLSPYMIYSQVTYGFPIPRLAVGYQATVGEYGAGLSGLFAYAEMFPSRVGLIFTSLLFLGMLYYLFNLVIGWGIKGHLKNNSNWFLIFICFFVPFALYTLYGTIGGSGTFYDAFILPVFPFAFAFAGLMIDKIYGVISKYNKQIAVILVVILLAYQAYSSLNIGDEAIKAKIGSYDSIKSAGLWVKENSNVGDKVISVSRPQITYYSERETYGIPENESAFSDLIKEIKPKYIVDSAWESRRAWLSDYLLANKDNLIPVNAYFYDEDQKKPVVVIYSVKSSSA